MQSLIQYRKLGLAIQKQLQKDPEKVAVHRNQLRYEPENLTTDPQTTSNFSSSGNFTDDRMLQPIGSNTTARTQYTTRTALSHTIAGICVRERTIYEGTGGTVFVVNWEGEQDPVNPRNWSLAYRIVATIVVGLISFVVGAASSADTAILPQAAAEFGVSDVVEAISIGTAVLNSQWL